MIQFKDDLNVLYSVSLDQVSHAIQTGLDNGKVRVSIHMENGQAVCAVVSNETSEYLRNTFKNEVFKLADDISHPNACLN